MENYNPSTKYFSNGGLGPLVAQIVGDEDGSVKLVYWNDESKAASPRVKTCRLSKKLFFSDRTGWRERPIKLLEMENDREVQAVLATIVGGSISKRDARRQLALSPEWIAYLYRKFLHRQQAAPLPHLYMGSDGEGT